MTSPDTRSASTPTRARLLLGVAGAAMMLTQYVAVREIGSTFFSTELVILAATIVAMVGPSIGYALADRLTAPVLAAWGVLSIAAQLALPVGLRALVGSLAARGFETWALGVTVTCGCLLLTGFHAVFLPRQARTAVSLPVLYATELVGALAALGVLLLAPSWRVALAAFWGAAVLVVHLGLGRWILTALVGAGAVAMFVLYPALDRWAVGVFMWGSYGHEAPSVVVSEVSPYQRIDIVDDVDGRSLYLDGVPFYRGGDLDAFNVMLAELPGSLRPARGAALVIGSGSFSSAARLHRLGYEVTVVELDGAVARLGFQHFAPLHRLQPGDVRLVIDDGRRFVARAPAASYDLVVLDVPAPYHVQTALLHTPDFYRAVATRLKPGGVAALSLCEDLDGRVGRSIAASALAAFGQVMVVESESVGLSFLYGARDAALPFTLADTAAALRATGPEGGRVLADAAVRQAVGGTRPLDRTRLAAVLVMARGALPEVGE